MTNYEKHKDAFIELLAANGGICEEIFCLRTNRETCPSCHDPEICKECELLNKQWLNEEVNEFDPAELKAGDKIRMRKFGEVDARTYEVVCNSFPALWLGFRGSENGVHQAHDENFLISYDDLLDEYEVREVLKND